MRPTCLLPLFAAGVLLTALSAASIHSRVAASSPEIAPMPAAPTVQANEGFLAGRVTTDHAVYEGRLRWGGDQEALWGNTFNGVKTGNPWVVPALSEVLPKERKSFQIFGIEIAGWTNPISLVRPFMARFGDIARIDLYSKDLRVTLKSGSVFHLYRNGADDMNDGVRVWDSRRLMNLEEWPIRSIEFLDSAGHGSSPSPLYGTIHTRRGDFTGSIEVVLPGIRSQ